MSNISKSYMPSGSTSLRRCALAWCSVLMLSVAAVLSAGCSADVDTVTAPASGGGDAASAVVGFNAYTERTTSPAATRAGWVGELNTPSLKESGADKSNGFGVFAYYSDNRFYESNQLPNFMYNEHVTWNPALGTDGLWHYTPEKYWPNEYGSAAQSDGVDRVSFFAYAPYVDVDKASGVPTTGTDRRGIVKLTANSYSGDPLVTYSSYGSEFGGGVDLCWAQPQLNMTRPTAASPADAGGRVPLEFRHALSQLSVNVDYVSDATSAPGQTIDDATTRIWVRSLKLTGMAHEGVLSLRSGSWTSDGREGVLSSAAVTVYDGRADGREAVVVNDGERPIGFSDALVQAHAYGDAAFTETGVTSTSQPLLSGMVIPTGLPVDVTIEYDVETRDDLTELLADGQTRGSSIKNVITRRAVFTRMESGRSYTLNLHLGMNSVKFDATVGDWNTAAISGGFTAPDAPKIGDLYYSDGTWGPKSKFDLTTDYPDKKVIGIVIANTTSPRDKALGYSNGYVLALDNAAANGAPTGNSTTMAWCADKANLRSTQVTGHTLSPVIDQAAADFSGLTIPADLDGLTYCNTARHGADLASDYTFKDLTAMYAAASYIPAGMTAETAAPASSSGWYLPSTGQLLIPIRQIAAANDINLDTWTPRTAGDNKWFEVKGHLISNPATENWLYLLNDPKLGDKLNAWITAQLPEGVASTPFRQSSGSDLTYWTSTEISADKVWANYWKYHVGYEGNQAKSKTYLVRPVLAF